MRATLAVMVFFLPFLYGYFEPDVPLDTPITLAPRGSVEQNIQIKSKVNYVVDIVFAKGSTPHEKLKELIGAMGICQIGEACSKGVAIPVRWTLRSTENGNIVASGEVNSFESSAWSAADVYRRIGGFSVDRGNYLFKLEVLRDVPELAILRTRVLIYHPFK